MQDVSGAGNRREEIIYLDLCSCEGKETTNK